MTVRGFYEEWIYDRFVWNGSMTEENGKMVVIIMCVPRV